jgi:tetratricopeptide (TPR) repeat protein
MNFINKYLLFLFSFLFFSITIQSQNTRIDSLKIELKNYKTNDTIRVNLLYRLAFSNFQRDSELTKFYLGKAEHLSNTLDYTKGKAKVLYLKGILENIKSNYTTSLNFFEQSLEHYESIQDQRGVASIYNAFGITHYDLSQYEEALHYYKNQPKLIKI